MSAYPAVRQNGSAVELIAPDQVTRLSPPAAIALARELMRAASQAEAAGRASKPAALCWLSQAVRASREVS